ncbi:MAG: hypothetical protein M0C28_35645 [Candidatus Moduliflexus flocculans]|nr:hypothetical protein [Candidatus Moduliflexus flocculans]
MGLKRAPGEGRDAEVLLEADRHRGPVPQGPGQRPQAGAHPLRLRHAPGRIHLHQLRPEEGLPADPGVRPLALLGLRPRRPRQRRVRGPGRAIFSYQLNISANRTTEALKLRVWANANFTHRRYEIPDEEPIVSDSNRKNLYLSLVKSIGGHWSWGGSVSRLFFDLRQRPALRLVRPGGRVRHLPLRRGDPAGAPAPVPPELRDAELLRARPSMTRTKENLFSQTLQAVLEIKEPLGLHRRLGPGIDLRARLEVQQSPGRARGLHQPVQGVLVQRQRPIQPHPRPALPAGPGLHPRGDPARAQAAGLGL